jgi:hypothetical protein
MENSDIGEHEDTDVKNERQKVFNLITSSATQEPPVVLVQVNDYKRDCISAILFYSYKHTNTEFAEGIPSTRGRLIL